MIIAIVGSRNFKNKKLVFEKIEEELEYIYLTKENKSNGVCLVSGGAKGVDTWAEEFAKKYWHDEAHYKVISPLQKESKLSYLFRNVEIVTLSDKILAFWDGISSGTRFTINYAKARGKQVIVFGEDGKTSN